jgi:hypothetical protein
LASAADNHWIIHTAESRPANTSPVLPVLRWVNARVNFPCPGVAVSVMDILLNVAFYAAETRLSIPKPLTQCRGAVLEGRQRRTARTQISLAYLRELSKKPMSNAQLVKVCRPQIFQVEIVAQANVFLPSNIVNSYWLQAQSIVDKWLKRRNIVSLE